MTLFKRMGFVALFLMNALFTCFAFAGGEVALTIDDLPFVGKTDGDPGKYRREQNRFNAVLEALEQNKVPAIGFVVAGAIEPGQWEWLEQFKKAGNLIGSHSYSHKSLGHTPINVYIEDVDKADKILSPLMSSPKYYRFPYLSEGMGTEKYNQFREYLFSHDYVVAPATIITNDDQFNLRFHQIPWQQRKQMINSFRQRYLSHIWAKTLQAEKHAEKIEHRPIKQILLIHMNTLNSYFLGDIIKMYRDHGYTFITLPEALKDPYYKNVRAQK